MTQPNNDEAYETFWQASKLNQYNLAEFSARQEQFSANDKHISLIEYAAAPQRLVKPWSLANRLAKRRKSERTFTTTPLTKRELGRLLSSFVAFDELEHRTYPSAGASYGVEIFCVALNVEAYGGKVLYYNPDRHAVSVVGDAPRWDELKPNTNVSVRGTPQCIMVFALFSDRLTEKYLERGGRFGLVEVGAAMQQLALQIAGSRNLKGVAAGGLVDDYWADLIGFGRSEVQIALGYLCGK